MTHPTFRRSLRGLSVLMLGAASLVACAAGPEPTDVSAESAALSTGSGLHADYFSNQSLTGPATLSRTDATVNFNWGTGSPGSSLPIDHFSVRWTGQVEALYSRRTPSPPPATMESVCGSTASRSSTTGPTTAVRRTRHNRADRRPTVRHPARVL